MTVDYLQPDDPLPPPDAADEDGIVAVGGTPTPKRLIEAYRKGIFPWPHEGYPLLWFSPDPRFVLVPQEAQINRSLKKALKNCPYEITADTQFRQVMAACAQTPRPGQDGTWITPDLIESYVELHEMGITHSIEAFESGKLVGGLYGVSFGGMFFGESMFANAKNASKICFATLLANLIYWDFDLVDCQAYTEHLERFGAIDWPKSRFLGILKNSLKKPDKLGKWHLDVNPLEAAHMFQK